MDSNAARIPLTFCSAIVSPRLDFTTPVWTEKSPRNFAKPSPRSGNRKSKPFWSRCASLRRREIPSERSTAFAFQNSPIRRILSTVGRLRRRKQNCCGWCCRNCAVDAVSAYPTRRKPSEMIFEPAKTKNGGPGET
jgi:hypothetical protein